MSNDAGSPSSSDRLQTWMMIVNPNAGGKKGTKHWPVISGLLRAEGIRFETRTTKGRSHAITLASEAAAAGYRKFCIVGGDGTLNEVVNGLMQVPGLDPADFLIGMIPVGTGNDWCRMYRIPFDYGAAVKTLKEEKRFVQDIGKVTFFQHGELRHRWFINVAGMGYDALVAKKTNLLKEKGRGGPFTYLYFVFAGLLQYKFMEAVIEVDNKVVYKGEVFSMNIGICKYNGGGMMQVPFAVPDDGLLDLMLIKKAPKWMVIRYANKLYDGTLVDLPIVITSRGKSIRIRSVGKIYLETDGESLGHTPFFFETDQNRLSVVVGEV